MRSKAFLFSFVVLCASNVAAGALSWSTQMNCYSDYYAYCSKHTAGSAGCHACMRANRAKLSSACVSALIGDGVLKDAKAAKPQTKLAGAAKARARHAPRRSVAVATTKAAKATATKDVDKPPPQSETSVAKAVAPTSPEPQVPTDPPPRAPEPPAAPARQAPAEQLSTQQAKAEPSMDQGTFEALKSRGPHFVVQEDIASIFSRADEKPESQAAPPTR